MRSSVTALLAAACLGWASPCAAVSVTGTDWNIHFSLPDQDFSEALGEYDIRDALLRRIDALQAGHSAVLGTYTLSAAGTAGMILSAISNALDRGASVKFIADHDINTGSVISGTSLAALAARPVNPLGLVQCASASGIMHDKIGLFDGGSTNRWVFVASWNFTSAASYAQWNIAIEIRNDRLFGAYTNEAREMLAGRFHNDPAKSHAHDATRFMLEGGWGESWVRFSPPPDGRSGGTNVLTDITNRIAAARQEIVFALNSATRQAVRDQLVNAANRGVIIHGAMPLSDLDPLDPLSSYAFYSYLTNTANYATTNIVHFITPYSEADGSALDAGQSDLVHEKFMVIDPLSSQPVLIHGSANWTDSALVSTNSNDENTLFLLHREIAGVFYAQFKRMTGMWTNRDDFWCDVRRSGGTMQVGLWTTDTNRFRVEHAPQIGPTWTTVVNTVTSFIGRSVLTTNAADPSGFYRARRE